MYRIANPYEPWPCFLPHPSVDATLALSREPLMPARVAGGNFMFSHIMVGSNDIEASRAFYDAALGALGIRHASENNGRLMYMHAGGLFMVTKPIDGAEACHANGGTIGFAADSPEAADAWHAAGLANGGTECEDAPGVRSASFGDLYLAYLRDPSGNKLCAMHRMPRASA
jgi:catechol 2,3-dioxygenase-like lactoylglutathione lyase family enzyme